MVLRDGCCSLMFIAISALVLPHLSRAEDFAEVHDEDDEDYTWKMLMQETTWKPGHVADATTSLPIRDMPCEGPGKILRSIPGYTWAKVKRLLWQSNSDRNEVLLVLAKIQKDESDDCVLGIVTSSTFLLPYTMPKLRNSARTLSGDLNLFLLNVTFFETLISGFPIFGIYDDLSTAEYRSWFQSSESAKYFDPLPELAVCGSPVQVLKEKLQDQRDTWHSANQTKGSKGSKGGEEIPGIYTGTGTVSGFLDAIEILDGSGECRPAAAAATLVLALTRAKARAKLKLIQEAKVS